MFCFRKNVGGIRILKLNYVSVFLKVTLIFMAMCMLNNYTMLHAMAPNVQTIDYSTYLKRSPTPLLTGETLWESPRSFVVLSEGSSIAYELEIPKEKEGLWNIRIDYEVLSSQILPPEISVYLNNKLPFLEARSIPLVQYWEYETMDFSKNRYGDEIIPNQRIASDTISYVLKNPNGVDKFPLWFNLRSPKVTLTLFVNSGKIAIKRLSIERLKSLTKFSEVVSKLDTKNSKGERRIITVQAEKPFRKNEASVNAIPVRSPDTVPYDTYNLVLNAFGGSNWKQPGQCVIYEFDIPETGYYKIAVKYRQDTKPNFTSYRTVYVDGAVIYSDLLEIPFEYTSDWKIYTLKSLDKTSDIVFYLTKGRHTIALEVNASVYSDVLNSLKAMIDYINKIALQIKFISGGSLDKNVEWEITDYIPDIEPKLKSLIKNLEIIKMKVAKINGNAWNAEYVSLNTAQMFLKRLIKDVNKIPNKLEMLNGSTGSVLSELSVAYNGLQEMPLTIDEIYIYKGKNIDGVVKSSPFKVFVEGFKRFVDSFNMHKNTTFSKSQKENIVMLRVWINRPRQYVDILQQLIDNDFTKKTGIYVDVSIMRDEGKLILANAAKKSPDIALGISNWIPFEMGIRGAALDLKRFSDFVEFSKNFYPGSLLPYLYENHCYGLPEALDFYVLFYRKDILEYLNIPIPKTWDDVKLILPELQRSGLNFYIPLSGTSSFKAWMTTAPFIMQYHGKLFTDDGLKTALDNPSTLKALKEMTELFTMYGMPAQVANFFESFRKGEIPLGVSNLNTYIQLTIAAPELRGMWSIAPSPGVKYGSTIERWQTGSAQAVAILNDTKFPMEAWEFVKWWLSKETQVSLVNRIVSTYGIEFLFIPSNQFAIDGIPLKTEHIKVVKEQFKWLQEVPKMPASYILEREISNIWNKVVLEGKPLKVAVDDSVIVVNKEFARKLEEFGYYKDGKPVKPFKIYTLEDVISWYMQDREAKDSKR
jgi:maltose-binding protein MalE